SMLFRRRLALLVTTLPLAFYVYACADDEVAPPAVEEQDAGQDGGGGGADTDTGTPPPPPPPDAGGEDTGAGDAGADAASADAGPVECSGNPLVADGGADGGVVIDPDGGALRAIATGQF